MRYNKLTVLSFAYNYIVVDTMSARNMIPNVAESLGTLLEEAGFVNVNVQFKLIPMNHGGKLGHFWW